MKYERYRLPMECTTLKCETKKNNMKNKGEQHKSVKFIFQNFFRFRMMNKILKELLITQI